VPSIFFRAAWVLERERRAEDMAPMS